MIAVPTTPRGRGGGRRLTNTLIPPSQIALLGGGAGGGGTDALPLIPSESGSSGGGPVPLLDEASAAGGGSVARLGGGSSDAPDADTDDEDDDVNRGGGGNGHGGSDYLDHRRESDAGVASTAAQGSASRSPVSPSGGSDLSSFSARARRSGRQAPSPLSIDSPRSGLGGFWTGAAGAAVAVGGGGGNAGHGQSQQDTPPSNAPLTPVRLVDGGDGFNYSLPPKTSKDVCAHCWSSLPSEERKAASLKTVGEAVLTCQISITYGTAPDAAPASTRYFAVSAARPVFVGRSREAFEDCYPEKVQKYGFVAVDDVTEQVHDAALWGASLERVFGFCGAFVCVCVCVCMCVCA